jgi:hypothetical protein
LSCRFQFSFIFEHIQKEADMRTKLIMLSLAAALIASEELPSRQMPQWVPGLKAS